MSEESKIIADDDWKQQAKKEKEKLDEKETPQQPQGLPPADFNSLINSLFIQAMFSMGKLQDPAAGEVQLNLDMAKFNIDLLQMLQEKTEGNLSDEETKMLASQLHEARMTFVAASQTA